MDGRTAPDRAQTIVGEGAARVDPDVLAKFKASGEGWQTRVHDALASYHAALRLDGDLADAHYNAARLHEQVGDTRQAVRHFSAYRRLQR